MRTYLEHSGIELEVRFFDEADAPTLPGNVYWRLDCAATGENLQDWTQVYPETHLDDFGNITEIVATIEVASSLNAIQDRANTREEKRLLVAAGKDEPREFSAEFPYQVMRVQGRA